MEDDKQLDLAALQCETGVSAQSVRFGSPLCSFCLARVTGGSEEAGVARLGEGWHLKSQSFTLRGDPEGCH